MKPGNPNISIEICEVCDEYVENCICPECPRCGEVGDLSCYQEVDLGVCGGLFGDENKR